MCTCTSVPGVLEIIADIITVILLPVIGIFISYSEHKRNVYHTKIEFLTQGNTEEEKDRRKKLYDRFEEQEHKLSEKDYEDLDANGDLGKIVSFYDMWASMVKTGYLPMKSFKGINGVTTVKLFYLLLPYINYRRKNVSEILCKNNCLDEQIVICNESYARDFEWLVNKIQKKKYVSVQHQNL